jgi:hypothetical protein
MEPKARVLLVGLDPAVVDYGSSPVPGWNAERVAAALAAEFAKLAELGYAVTPLYVDTGATAAAVVTEALAREAYDCILIGAGVRVIPTHFLLFEQLINVVHRHAPATTRLCFNTGPSDSVAAVQRWV